MRTYVVQPGDSPAQIAAEFAGCPKCAIDLVVANPQKPSVRHPNGFLSFRDMRAGERLTLPDKWFSREFDALPSAYFAALPYPDGVSTGVSGTLGDYASLDAATLNVNTLASKNDREFAESVNRVAAQIDASVVDAYDGGTMSRALADTVRTATDSARSRNERLKSALDAGEPESVVKSARLEVQNSLTSALGAARITLEALHAESQIEVEIGEVVIDSPAPSSAPPSPSPTAPAPAPVVVTGSPEEERGLSTAAVLGMGLLGAGVVGGGIYYWTQLRRPKVRRVREEEHDDR